MGDSGATRPDRQRFEVLDSLRGVCACLIVLLHFKTPGIISHSTFIDHAFLFVDFFFVLSGFVIAASYGAKLRDGFPIRRFIGLRLGRIYPLHLAMLLCFLAFELFFAIAAAKGADRQPFTGVNSLPMFLASLLLVQTFVGPDATFWNGPSWSIAVEMWTYLIFALATRLAGRWLVPLALLTAAACCIYLAQLTDRYLSVFHDGALARCLYGFALGVVALSLHRRIGARPLGRMPATMLEGLVTVAVVALVILSGPTPLSLAMPPLFFAAVLVFARQEGWLSRLLLARPFLLLGTLSYSIYMVHGFLEYRLVNVLQVVQRLGHDRWQLTATVDGHNQIGGSMLFGDVMSIIALLLTIACASVTYRLMERPGQRWSRARLLGDHPSRAATRAERVAPTF